MPHIREIARRAGAAAGAMALVVLLLPPAVARTDEAANAANGSGVAPVAACLERNLPRRTSEQFIEFTAYDRTGGRRVARAKVLAKRFDDGLRRLLMRFIRPFDMRGTALLFLEQPDGRSDTYLYAPELGREKRIHPDSAAGSLLGTDFSAEDFERWQSLDRREPLERLPDAELDGQPVYVVEARPPTGSPSPYEKVVSYVDKKTCVVLRSESFASGGELRKVLSVDPESILRVDDVFLATELRMDDLRDGTHTTVLVDDPMVDLPIDDGEFLVSSLRKPSRPAKRGS